MKDKLIWALVALVLIVSVAMYKYPYPPRYITPDVAMGKHTDDNHPCPPFCETRGGHTITE